MSSTVRVDIREGRSRRLRPFVSMNLPSSVLASGLLIGASRGCPARAAGPTRRRPSAAQLVQPSLGARAPTSRGCSASSANSGSKFVARRAHGLDAGTKSTSTRRRDGAKCPCCWRSSRTPPARRARMRDRHGGVAHGCGRGAELRFDPTTLNSVDTDMRLRQRDPAGPRFADAGRPRPGCPARGRGQARQFAEGSHTFRSCRPGWPRSPTARCARRSRRPSPCSSSTIPTRRCRSAAVQQLADLNSIGSARRR